MSSKALYGPRRWPTGRPRDERSKLLTGAELAEFAGHDLKSWDVEPWLRHHGVPVDVGTRVLNWLGNSKEEGTGTLRSVVSHYDPTNSSGMMDPVRGHWRHQRNGGQPLDESDHAARDILIKAIMEAKKGMPEEGGIAVLLDTWKWAPAGVVEETKWWSGRSAYYGGRAPMSRMDDLPDDALRCICEQLVPLVPPKEEPSSPGGYVSQSNEEFIAESRKSCEEDTTDAALQLRGEVALDELSESLGINDSALRHRIQSWRRERGPVSVLCKVSKQWRAGLKKHIDVLRAEIARYEAHLAVLADARDKVDNHRVSRFGEPRDPYDEDY